MSPPDVEWPRRSRAPGRFGVEFPHEQRPTADAGAGLVKAGNRGVRRARSCVAAGDRTGNARQVDLCARCHNEPAAYVGYSLRVAGRHVPGSCECWWARHPAGLFPGPERMPRIRLGRRQRPVSRADVAHRLPGRADTNWKSFRVTPGKKPDANAYKRWFSLGTPWKSPSTIFARLRASWDFWACGLLCFRKAMIPSRKTLTAR